jgi:hypothetical protein
MKLFKMLLTLVVFSAALAANAHAGTLYSIATTTGVITTAADIGADITGAVEISQIELENSGATAQTVTFYKLGASTTTATAIMTIELPAAIGQYPVFAGQLNYNDRISVTDLMIWKSSTSSNVTANLIVQ